MARVKWDCEEDQMGEAVLESPNQEKQGSFSCLRVTKCFMQPSPVNSLWLFAY